MKFIRRRADNGHVLPFWKLFTKSPIFAPMKRLLHLLPFYILLLSAMPCKADDGCCSDEVITTAAHQNKTLPNEKSSLPCSPFFACGACHGFIVPDSGIPVEHQETPPVPKSTLPESNTLPGFASFIWQPPRMS
jgi:hypothetical protein